jgi:hypothetical protein
LFLNKDGIDIIYWHHCFGCRIFRWTTSTSLFVDMLAVLQCLLLTSSGRLRYAGGFRPLDVLGCAWMRWRFGAGTRWLIGLDSIRDYLRLDFLGRIFDCWRSSRTVADFVSLRTAMNRHFSGRTIQANLTFHADGLAWTRLRDFSGWTFRVEFFSGTVLGSWAPIS